MHIFEIKYSRGRTVQPRAYESDRIDVELTSQLTEGEDVAAVMKTLRELTMKEVGRGPGKTTVAVEAKETTSGPAGVEENIAAQSASEAGGEETATETATDAAATKKAKTAAARKAKAAEKKAAEKPTEPTDDGRDAAGVVGDIQDEELVAEAAKAAGSITPQGVKDIMADFGVPRLSKVAQERRSEFIEKLHAAVKARKEADAAETEENEIPL